jgi:hypothetical protein
MQNNYEYHNYHTYLLMKIFKSIITKKMNINKEMNTFRFESVLNGGQNVKTNTDPDNEIAIIIRIHCKNEIFINHNIEIGM